MPIQINTAGKIVDEMANFLMLQINDESILLMVFWGKK